MSILLSTALLAATGGLLAHGPAGAPDGDEWVTDFAKAKAMATEQGKDLLIDFTGSDWCIWCKRLKAEVFDQEAFAAAKEHFIFVELDFPRDQSLISPELKKQNDELQKRFAIKGFPTIILADASGMPFASTGYQEGGAEPYLTHLDELRENKVKRDAAVAEAKQAEGIEAAKAWHAALEALPEELGMHYRAWMEKIIALDSEDEAGLKSIYSQRLAEMDLKAQQDQLEAEVQAVLEPAEGEEMPSPEQFQRGAGLVKTFLDKNEALPSEARMQLLLMHGTLSERGGDLAAAIKSLKAAAEAMPDNPLVPRIQQYVQGLEQKLADKKDG